MTRVRRSGFVLMAGPPRRKKKSKGGSSASIPAMGEKQPPMNPKTMGIIAGVAVLAIAGYLGMQQLNEQQNAAQNAVNEPIKRDNPPPVVANHPAPTPNNLPTALPNASAMAPGTPAQQDLSSTGPDEPNAASDASAAPMDPSGAPFATKNPLVALIQGDTSVLTGTSGTDATAKDATLFITLEDGQHIPVTSQEFEAYSRGELPREQIERLIVRAGNFSIGNATFVSTHRGAGGGLGGMLIGSNFDANSVQSFLAQVTIKKIDGSTVKSTGCLMHPEGGIILPAQALEDGVDLTVEFQNQTFRTSEISVGFTDDATRLAFLKLPTQDQQVPVVPLAQPQLVPMAVSASLVNLVDGKVVRTEVTAQPVNYQILSGETVIPITGNWLDVRGETNAEVGQPLFDKSGALLGYSIAPSMSQPNGVVAVASEALQRLTTIPLMSDPAAAPSDIMTDPSLLQPASDVAASKVQQLFFAPSIAETKQGRELLTSIRWIQLGTLVKTNAGAPPPTGLLGRVMGTLGRQSLEKTDVNLATPEKAPLAAILMCVIEYNTPAPNPVGLPVAQDMDMTFRLLAFARNPDDPSGEGYVRVLEVEPVILRVPSTFQEQGIASRTMKEQIVNMYNKFHSGIRKAKRDLERL